MSNTYTVDLNNVAKEYERIYLKNVEKVNPNKDIIIIPRKGDS